MCLLISGACGYSSLALSLIVCRDILVPRGDNSHWANIHSKMLVVSNVDKSFSACLLLCDANAKLLMLHVLYR